MTKKCADALKPLLQGRINELMSKTPMLAGKGEFPKQKGLYALSENGTCLYVGIATNLRNRLRSHVHGSSLAKKIALETMQKNGIARPRGRKVRLANDDYRLARKPALERIESMEVRFIIWSGDDDDLMVLERYAAHALGSRYNRTLTMLAEADG